VDILGGVVLTIESIAVKTKSGSGLKLTGQLGEVMSESANIAYTFINHLCRITMRRERFLKSL
jgi:ATP-dependent Lon protease